MASKIPRQRPEVGFTTRRTSTDDLETSQENDRNRRKCPVWAPPPSLHSDFPAKQISHEDLVDDARRPCRPSKVILERGSSRGTRKDHPKFSSRKTPVKTRTPLAKKTIDLPDGCVQQGSRSRRRPSPCLPKKKTPHWLRARCFRFHRFPRRILTRFFFPKWRRLRGPLSTVPRFSGQIQIIWRSFWKSLLA